MTKGVPKKSKKENTTTQKTSHFELSRIVPLTPNQQKTFDAYSSGFQLQLHGFAGTGKTFISIYLALKEILDLKSPYKKIVIIRSVVPSRDMGFLPGSIKEKTRIFEEPYMEICNTIFSRGDGWEILKTKNLIEFTTTSFLRGTTFNDAIVIVDETQNMTFPEIDTIMTRMGENSRVIFCGDYRQTDLNKRDEKEGITKFILITDKLKSFKHIEFQKEDIVRSSLVKSYIIEKTNLGF